MFLGNIFFVGPHSNYFITFGLVLKCSKYKLTFLQKPVNSSLPNIKTVIELETCLQYIVYNIELCSKKIKIIIILNSFNISLIFSLNVNAFKCYFYSKNIK